MRHVEPDHRHVESAREHTTRGLRIGPDVELGRGRDIALRNRAAHEDDPLRPSLRVARQEERDVRQRPGRDERRAGDALREEVDGVLGDRTSPRLRQLRPVEPGLAVDVGGDERLTDERAAGAGRDRHVVPSDELEHPKRVGRRLLHSLVAGHRRDAQELDLLAREREQERDRVVVPGVAVEENRGRSHPRE